VIIMSGATVITALGLGVAPALVPLSVGLLSGAIAYGRWQSAPARESAQPAMLLPVI
jgi:hypothetical protein